MVCRVEDADSRQGKDCSGLAGHRPGIGRMYHLGFQRQMEIEKAG